MIDSLLPKVVGVDKSSFLPTVGKHYQGFFINSSSEYSTADSDDASEDSDDDTSDTSNDDDQLDVASPTPPPKKTRRVYVRKPMHSSAWWTVFLSQEANAILINDPHGKDATSFRLEFRVHYLVFKEKILDFSERMWWPEWHEYKVDAFGYPVGCLELKLLGCLNTLGMGTNHFFVGLQTNIGEELHRKFSVEWISLMTSVNHLFIYMPREEIQLKFVVDEYKAMGLPGCVGSVDCAHIGWDLCPVQ
jgi:hypothetical protein